MYHYCIFAALADIVPDVDKLKSSLESFNAIQVHSMDSLQCAYEEGCLSPSATPGGNPRQALLVCKSYATSLKLHALPCIPLCIHIYTCK